MEINKTAIGWVLAGILIIVFLFLTFTDTKFELLADCGDGSPLTLNQLDCRLRWCSALNKRVTADENCPQSTCPDGQKRFNLFYCEKYTCADGSEVGIPEKCVKYTCLDGNKTDDPKSCREYCEAPSDCNPDKAEVKECFGEWTCQANKCSWKCEASFTKTKVEEIALSLGELVEEGYSQIGEQKITESEDGDVLVSAFENARTKISFAQIIIASKKGEEKAQIANSFNKSVNNIIKLGNESFGNFEFGEDSFATRLKKENIEEQTIPHSAEAQVNYDYGNGYMLMFRKSNIIVMLILTAENDEKAAEAFNKYAQELESRIN